MKNIFKLATPIGDFRALNEIGCEGSNNFNQMDKNILNSPKAIENIKKRWLKVGPWVNVYFFDKNIHVKNQFIGNWGGSI